MPSIDGGWKPGDKLPTQPAIKDQFVAMGKHVLRLRDADVADAAFMGKMYVTGGAVMAIFCISNAVPLILSTENWDASELFFYFLLT
jgi:hypothetical protein